MRMTVIDVCLYVCNYYSCLAMASDFSIQERRGTLPEMCRSSGVIRMKC